MAYNFIFPTIRKNPNYQFDTVMSNYQTNFEMIQSGSTTFSGGTITGDLNVLGNFQLSGINISTLFVSSFDIIDGGSW